MEPPHIVQIQLKNLIPVGTAIRNDTKLKNGLLTAPVVNMWGAHPPMEGPAIATAASRIPVEPNTARPENVEITSLTTPKYGRISTYTSGCPKNQNRCWYRIGLPPNAGSNTCPPSPRSTNSSSSVAVSDGNAMKISSAVAIISQVKIGSRHIVIPGARRVNAVVTKFSAVMIDATDTIASPTIQKSWPKPVEIVISESGAYDVQPADAAPSFVAAPANTTSPPNRNIQYEVAFSRGNAMSGAPICSGMR